MSSLKKMLKKYFNNELTDEMIIHFNSGYTIYPPPFAEVDIFMNWKLKIKEQTDEL